MGQGVFALSKEELLALDVTPEELEHFRPYFDLCDLDRYFIAEESSLSILYSTRQTIPDINKYPGIYNHLHCFRDIMENRRETKKGSNSWWHLHWPRDESLWKKSKILSVQMAFRPTFVPAQGEVLVPFSVNMFVPFESTNEHVDYITGLLNSKLLWKWFRHHAKRRGVGLEINGNVLSMAPIRTINFTNAKEAAMHDELVRSVADMMSVQRDLRRVRIEQQKSVLRQQINAIDRQIDQLVYQLYGLTDDEIAVVEEAVS